MPETPRLPGGIDPGPSFRFDDLTGSRRSVLHVLKLMAQAALAGLSFRRPKPRGRYRFAMFPMHQTKYAQLAPFLDVLGSEPLFLLAPWPQPRIAIFNAFIQESGRPWVMLHEALP